MGTEEREKVDGKIVVTMGQRLPPQQALISKTKWDPEHQLYLCPFLLATLFKDTRKVREQAQVTKARRKNFNNCSSIKQQKGKISLILA